MAKIPRFQTSPAVPSSAQDEGAERLRIPKFKTAPNIGPVRQFEDIFTKKIEAEKQHGSRTASAAAIRKCETYQRVRVTFQEVGANVQQTPSPDPDALPLPSRIFDSLRHRIGGSTRRGESIASDRDSEVRL